MTYQVLARKWRPKKFAEVVGQMHVLQALVYALDHDRLHHAYLFSGTRGVGKTTLGRLLAKSLNCATGVSSTPCGECSPCQEIDAGRFIDLLEIDAASRTKVEDTRELLDNVQYAPTNGRYKVYLIDEVHMLSNHSFNALLKTLEEPPAHVKFILATTDPQRLPVTILSRCLQFNLKCIDETRIEQHLAHVLNNESIVFESSALALLSQAAKGSLRDALSLLDQAISQGNGEVEDASVRTMLGTINRDYVYGLLAALSSNDASQLFEHIDHLAQQGVDFSAVLAELMSVLHQIAVAQLLPPSQTDAIQSELAAKLSPEDVQLCYQIALMGRRDLPFAFNARSGFEMILLRMLAFRPVSTKTASNEVVLADTPTTAVVKTPTAKTSPPALGSVSTQIDGNASWQQIIESMSLSGIVKQLALNCICLGREGDSFNLVLQKSHAQLASRMMIDRLQQALTKMFETPIRVKLTVGEVKEETPAMQQTRKQSERLQAAVEVIEADPIVKDIKATFDATVEANAIRLVDNVTD